ncbi:MAG TPA: malectin domain-containing carbohydrate-binding protein, partial [Candidatus Dormibacteraeota bacterium]|nr:malectin domain-containing carbohydrate-binding protein [Candidatus Dormibacteraeota bacterium]
SINGTQVLTNFDIVAAAGAANRAIIQQFATTADASGKINIAFNLGTANNPKVDGIEVLAGALPAAPTNLTATPGNTQVSLSWTASSGAASYNVKRSTTTGGPYSSIATGVTTTNFTDTGLTSGTTYFYVVSAVNSNGESANSNQVSATPSGSGTPVFQISAGSPSGASGIAPYVADEDFSGGTAALHSVTVDTSHVTNPAPQAVYQYERYGNAANFSYTLPGLTAGASYTVRLHFAETYFTTTGQRIFNVSINGTQVLTNFDIVAAAGAANRAIIEQFTAAADSSGKITILFNPGTANNPKVDGIEVLK